MRTALSTRLQGTLLFHLNLNYSSIEVEKRREVIERCYRPLLELAEKREWLTLAIEASGHTLERIERLDPEWIRLLRALNDAGRVEFVGSGDTQLIGPLVPAAVNRWNQELGCLTYRRLLGRVPRVALVNEMAWSQGLVDAYLDAGYEAVVAEWNNARRTHPEWDERLQYRSVWTRSPTDRRIRVLWANAVLFQRFQRVARGEMDTEEYVSAIVPSGGDEPRHAFLYASDAEVFDYRPGRYSAEPALPASRESEWRRIGELIDELHRSGLAFTSPARVLDDERFAPEAEVELSDAANPIPVKKQPKYNVTRWALSGWDDVGVNARCFGRAKALERRGGSPRDWQLLCRAWGSDLRTHLTEKRWRRFAQALPAPEEELSDSSFHDAPLRSRVVERGPKRLGVATDGVRVVLNLRRGLAIDALTLRQAGPAPLVGTLPLGYFDDIDWAADFYSGHCVLEVPAEQRVTDLAAVEPEVEELTHFVSVRALVPTALGPLPKEVRVYAHRVEIRWGFARWGTRPRASPRAGALTLLDGALGEELWITCANGGPRERLRLVEGCDHARSVSALISASTAFGATDGTIAIEDGRAGFEAAWPQEEAAALPLVTCRRIGGKRFVRLQFSLSELDETHRPGAPLHDFRLSIRPYRKRR